MMSNPIGWVMGVASFTDAWIETSELLNLGKGDKVASFTDAWIETQGGVSLINLVSRIFYRCVD